MAQLYDLKNVLITIGGIPMGGFGNNEAAVLQFGDDAKSSDVSADGQVVVSRNNDPRLFVVLTFLQTSGSIPVLEDFRNLQDGVEAGVGPALIPPLPFSLFNFTNDETVFDPNTIFMSQPGIPFGKNVGQTQYTLLLPGPDYSLGTLNRNQVVQP